MGDWHVGRKFSVLKTRGDVDGRAREGAAGMQDESGTTPYSHTTPLAGFLISEI